MRDSFGRHIHYLRLSVTDRCDFRCSYCLPRSYRGFATPKEWMTPIEIARLAGVFVKLGVEHIRLTGGEPLVRRELLEIVQRVSVLPGLRDVSLSTNASQLATQAYSLRDAGVKRLNISLDSLDPEKFSAITGGNLEGVLSGIDEAGAAGFAPIKINTVAMRGVNDDEFDDIVDFCLERKLALRFIETMPVGASGQTMQDRYLPLIEVEQQLRKRFTLTSTTLHGSGPARYFQVDDSKLCIGFITPQSQHFCATCNRVRLSVRGDLFLCLGQENKVPLGEQIRAGATDDELMAAILDGISRKPEAHSFRTTPTAILRPMSALGG